MYWHAISPTPDAIPDEMHFVIKGDVSSFLRYHATAEDKNNGDRPEVICLLDGNMVRILMGMTRVDARTRSKIILSKNRYY
mmetsp:Transcript_23564/g.36511  ORF Transcript_23564/g.36511 Transcript_23564/m.36511 type:complete len:81 (+) Transcript_23564:69-311(+)